LQVTYFLASMVSYLQSPWTWFALALGAIVGSFLNVCIIRIPKGMFWRYSRSVCLNCESPIPAYYNIPILSFIFLRGRAGCCGVKLSWQYPIIELFSALVFCLLYWKFPFIMDYGGRYQIHGPDALRFLHASTLFSVLLVCSVIDLRYMIIPDVISIPTIALTPLVVLLHPDLSWTSAGLGVVLGAGSLYAVAWLYWWLRREVGLGFGDVKLLAAIGGWLGYQAIIPIIFVGSMSGAIVGIIVMIVSKQHSMRSAIPFGPFLAFGAMVYLVYGDLLRRWLEL